MAKKMYVTYCSKEKNHSEKDMKAMDRYLSERIEYVQALAKQDGADFMILSGKFGLLKPTDLIPDYDHLLKPFETTRHGKMIAKQLKSIKVQEIVYYTHWMDKDVNVAPYIESLSDACELAKMKLELIILDDDVAL